MDNRNKKLLSGRITAGIPTKGPLTDSQRMDTKIKVEHGNNHSYSLPLIHAHLGLVKEIDIFQQPSNLKNNWSHFEKKSNTKIQTLDETVMAQQPWSRGFIFNGDYNYPKEHNDTKAGQLQNFEILGNADPANFTTSGKSSKNRNQNTTKAQTRGNKNAPSAARTTTTPRLAGKTVMQIVNSAMSEYDRMTGVRSIGHITVKTNASSAAGIIMASQLAGNPDTETANSTMWMYEYDRMTNVIYGGHAQASQEWTIGQVAIKAKGKITAGGTSTPRITSRISLIAPPQTNMADQITSTLPNSIPSSPPAFELTSFGSYNHDISVLQNSNMENSHGFEKIDKGPYWFESSQLPLLKTIKQEKLQKIDDRSCCIDLNDFSFLKANTETEPRVRNVSTPKPAAATKSEHDVQHPKPNSPPPESPKISLHKTDHLQPEEQQHTHPLLEARVIQQNAKSVLETSRNKRHQEKQGPHPRNRNPKNHNTTRKNQGKHLGPDELDWLVLYNRDNIPANGILSQKYWKRAAEEFEKKFNKRQSPTSLANSFSNGDIAARIRARRSQANGVVSTTNKRPWLHLEHVWFAKRVGNKTHSEIDFVELEKAFQQIYGIERSAAEWEAKWYSEKRQRTQALRKRAKAG